MLLVLELGPPRSLSLSHYSVLAFALTQDHSNLILTALVTYFRIYIFKLLFILYFFPSLTSFYTYITFLFLHLLRLDNILFSEPGL